MANVYIEWDEGFEEQAFHWRSSLNPLGNQVRDVTDEISKRVIGLAKNEAARFQGTAEDVRGIIRKNNRQERLRYFRNKAMAYSLTQYANLVRPIMVRDGKENYGAVVAYHAAADKIEFGGKDEQIELGNTGQRLDYPAFSFLRRGLG